MKCEGECSGTILCNASTLRSAPVFGLEYSKVTYSKLLAVADEDGYVSIINTLKELPTSLDDDSSPRRPSAQWTAHNNAVFDLAWSNNDRWMLTASGDMTIKLWDTGYASKLATFAGHTGSVKAISVSPHGPEVFASGARDGVLLLWDTRMNACTCPNRSSSTMHPVLSVSEPHAWQTPRSNSRKKGTLQGRPRPSVTAVQFLNEGTGHVLASGGVDGNVKFWDVRYAVQPTVTLPAIPLADTAETLRMNLAASNKEASLAHIASGCSPQLGQRSHAITSLALRPNGSQLMVSLTGGHHLLYDVFRPEAGPVRWYGGHSVSSFYVKGGFSPDGSHFVSGSSDAGVYIWQVDDKEGTEPYVLRSHESEVTTVTWCPTDFGQLASAADDYTVKVWNMHRSQAEEKRDPPSGWARRPNLNSWRSGEGALRPFSSVEREEAQVVLAGSSAVALGASEARQAAECQTPAVAVATESAHLAASTGRGERPRKMRISNALRLAAERPPKRPTKQQTLAEVLQAAQSKGSAGSATGQKRPWSACSGSDDDGPVMQRASQNENVPTNMAT